MATSCGDALGVHGGPGPCRPAMDAGHAPQAVATGEEAPAQAESQSWHSKCSQTKGGTTCAVCSLAGRQPPPFSAT